MRWAGLVATWGYEKCIQDFDQKTRVKRPLRRSRDRWEDNIKMDLRKIGWEVVEWIHLAQDRDQWRVFVNTVINIQVS
jgi:hypothetical protein